MKKLLIGVSSLIFLLIAVTAVGADGDESTARSVSEEERYKATQEAIQRAVRGVAATKTEYKKTYQSVHHEQIGQYVGSRVKLETYFGRKVEGVLRRVKGNMIYIDQHIAQGSASYPIDKRKVSGLKVLK